MEGNQENRQINDLKTLSYLKECLQWCADHFSVTINDLCSGAKEKRPNIVTEEDHSKIRRPIDSPFQVVVLGQTNSGKSSVINEILGGDFLPTSDLPCTKLPIKLVFSERGEEFQQLVNGKGEVIQTCALRKKRRVQMNDYVTFIEESALHSTREQLNVRVGLNHDLLKNGVELIDTPGVGQSEDLDKVIHGVTEGIFQLFLYVVDGNYGVRKEDRDLLDDLKRQRPDAPFFFICNKVDVLSGELDKLSDEEEKDEREEAPVDTTKDSKVHQQLIEIGFITQEKAGDPRGVYHGISTRQVRKARKRNDVDSEFVGPFKTMIESLIGVMTGTIQIYLHESLLILDRLQTSLIIGHLSTKTSTYTNSPKGAAVIDTFQQTLYRSLKNIAKKTEERIFRELERSKPIIMGSAASMKFATISVGPEIRRDEVIQQCTKQIRNLVVSKTVQTISDVEDEISELFRQEVRSKLQLFEVDFGGMPGLYDAVASFVRRQSEHYYCGKKKLINSYNFFEGQQNMVSALKNWFSTAMSFVIGDGFVDVGSDWKRGVASDVWKQLDLGRVANELQAAMLDQLKTSRNTLKENIKKSLSAEAMNDESARKQLAVLAPQIALQLCETLSLLNQLDYGPIQVVQDGANCPVPIYIGSSTKTSECNPWGRRESCAITTVSENAMEAMGPQVQKPWDDVDTGAREQTTQASAEANVPSMLQASSDATSSSTTSKSFLTWDRKLAIQLLTDRFSPRHPNILPWLGPALVLEGGVWQRGIVTPVYYKSLYTMLSSEESLKFSDCLKIAREICDAGEYLHSTGQQFNDLRVTNVLMDHSGHVKINNLGLRDDSVPYPDGQPPFHIAPEDYDNPSSGRTCDIYAFGILWWFMCEGKYERPKYAKGIPEEIRKAVQKGDRPLPMSEQEKSEYLKIAKACWAKTKKDRKNFTWLKKANGTLSAGKSLEEMKASKK